MITATTHRDHEPTTSIATPQSDDARGRRGRRGSAGWPAIMVPFGAAASPDLTILPVFLAATTAGVATAVGSLVIFAAVTIGTIVGLTLAATPAATRSAASGSSAGAT